MKKIILTLISVLIALGGASMYQVRDMSMYNVPNLIMETVTKPAEIEPVTMKVEHLSTEKPTEESTEYTYIYTYFSTEPTIATSDEGEAETEPSTEAKTYNGIVEGEVITGELSYYCLCLKCCGKTDGITASGYVIENGVQSYTASCNWLPFGAVIEIEGIEYTIRDRGGRRLDEVGKVDLFEPSGHAAALVGGRRKGIEVKIVSLP